MSIWKLKPACKDYVWGGRRLVDEFGIDGGEICAEAWMLSAHPDGASTIVNGSFAGQTLADALKTHAEFSGTNCKHFGEFPILIKFIDAKQNLSVQVHPNDDYALAHEGQLGKNEMWYVIDAEENAQLYCGVNKKISRDEFAARIKDNSLTEILHAAKVHRGDTFFIPAGTIHAVGKGILLAEIQQSSNVSYRVFDYGRNRPLHIAQALDVTNLTPFDTRGKSYPHVAACEDFVVDKLDLDGKIFSRASGTVGEETFLSVLILGGDGEISCGDEKFSLRKGDSFFLTAGSGDWEIRGKCDALLTTVP